MLSKLDLNGVALLRIQPTASSNDPIRVTGIGIKSPEEMIGEANVIAICATAEEFSQGLAPSLCWARPSPNSSPRRSQLIVGLSKDGSTTVAALQLTERDRDAFDAWLAAAKMLGKAKLLSDPSSPERREMPRVAIRFLSLAFSELAPEAGLMLKVGGGAGKAYPKGTVYVLGSSQQEGNLVFDGKFSVQISETDVSPFKV